MLFEKQVEKMYRAQLYVRQDNPHGVFYFGPEDFPGLQVHPYTFQSQLGHTLQGWFYHYENHIPGRLVVFDHGMGNGHRAYMREIETLCKGGYLVFAYDHTGCMASGGKSINGFAQSLMDLDDCIKVLKEEPELAGRSISVMGHSWGGFSTMNIAALHPQITHVVAMSGFISVERIVKQHMAGILRVFAPAMLDLEQRNSPRYARYNALESLGKTTAKVLLIHSADDAVVHKTVHFDPLQEKLSKKKNIRFLLVDGKNHAPGYTLEAAQYHKEFEKQFLAALKKKSLDTREKQQAFMGQFDFWRMTEQDEEIWQAIFEHLRS